MPIWMVLAKSSSRTGALSRMPYRLTPIKAFMQHRSLCTSSSSKRNNSTCSIGCLASARCIACNVGICGSLSSRFTSRLPRLGTCQQHERPATWKKSSLACIWFLFGSYLDLIWYDLLLFENYSDFILSYLSLISLYLILFGRIWSYSSLIWSDLDLIWIFFGFIWISVCFVWVSFGSWKGKSELSKKASIICI